LLDQARQANSPFLLFLNYMDAHAPYLPPAPYDAMYPGRDMGYSLASYAETAARVNDKNLPMTAKERAHLVSQYDGAIAYLDEKIAELVAHLKQNGQFDRTMIVITADHGEAFGDRNIMAHDTSVYQDQVHVPLIVKYPEQTRAERVDALTSHVDIMPTVLDVLNIKAPAAMQGIDLRRTGEAPGRVVVAEMHGSVSWSEPRFAQIEWALYSGSHKMIYSDKGTRELYDLSTDPTELHNLYRQDAPQVAELRTRLVDWSRRTLPQYRDPDSASREVEKRLESLGYAHKGVD
jgi:arylsulfatase A-like enzyme